MQYLENYSLKNHNTFKVDVSARHYIEITHPDDIFKIRQNQAFKDLPVHILGGGSNTLFTKDFDGIVIKVAINGIARISEDEEHVQLQVGAGENWHDFVMWSVEQNYSGVENLAYIPGTVGAAPVQNIAAYGQTFEDVLVEVETVNIANGETQTFTQEQTKPAYRSSIFKTEYSNQLLVTYVTVKLNKFLSYDTHYHGRFSYESLEMWLRQIKEPPYSPKDIAEAVVLQRKAKLPEVDEFPSCGSFFVNPFVTVDTFRKLEAKLEGLQHYPITKMEYDRLDWHDTGQDEIVKIPAGRLLDELGWKGKWIGNVGVHDKHALIVITNGNASGAEILEFTNQMKQSVLDAFQIELISEVQIV